MQSRSVAQLVGCLGRSRPDDQRVQLKHVCQREIDRLELAGLTLSHGADLLLRGVGVVVGEDLKCLGVLCDQTSSYVADALAHLLSGHDPQVAAWEFLDEYRRARGIAVGLELPWDRDDVAVADATDLDDLHGLSIYTDITLCLSGVPVAVGYLEDGVDNCRRDALAGALELLSDDLP